MAFCSESGGKITLNLSKEEAFVENVLNERKERDQKQKINIADSDISLLLDMVKTSSAICKE